MLCVPLVKVVNRRPCCVYHAYLQFTEGHLVFAVFTAALSVFTLEAQVVRDVLPHHPLLALPQGARDFKEWTHVEVVLRQTGRGHRSALISTHSGVDLHLNWLETNCSISIS